MMKVTMQPQEWQTLSFTPPPEEKLPARKPVPRKSATHHVILMSEDEVAEHFSICRRQLYNWRMSGYVPYLKIGKSVRFRLTDIEEMIERHLKQNAPQDTLQPKTKPSKP